jgi:putative DNA primase/helicase
MSHPLFLHVRAEAIPLRMRQEPRWVMWRSDLRDGKWTKVPYQVTRGAPLRAKSTDPATWSTFEAAHDLYRAGMTYRGVGFVLGAGWTGIDLDHCCVDPHGPVDDWAARIVDRASSYTEFSASGSGLHVILEGGDLPAGRSRQGGIEMYGSGRYFTMTGWALPGRGGVRALDSDALGTLRDSILPPRQTMPTAPPTSVRLTFDDSELLEHARGAANGAKFTLLYDRGDVGAHGDDDSAADLALASHLLFWANGDRAQADRLFRASALMRPKWDEMRGAATYGERTLSTANTSSGMSDTLLSQPRAKPSRGIPVGLL